MNALQELIKAFSLVEEFDRQRNNLIKEYRLYYNEDGSIVGLWESNFPESGNYIILNDPDIFHRHNSNLLKVKNKELVHIDPVASSLVQLRKSNTGQKTVKGYASLVVEDHENFQHIEFYDIANN